VNEKDKPIADGTWLDDLPIQSENIAFTAEEMLACGNCRRTNPPNRSKCFYCGSDLDIGVEKLAETKPTLRRLEHWEKGYNVVVLGQQNSEACINEPAVARELGLPREMVTKAFSTGAKLPVARVETERDAEILCLRLKNQGIETRIVSDETLNVRRGPRRIRELEFQDGVILTTDFNTREKKVVPTSDLVLIVTGTLFELKTASLEKRKKRKAKVLERSETSLDESVLDLYMRQDHTGFRIYESGFDFSCLGSNKSLFASENMPKLVRRLVMTCVNAKLDERYSEVQDALAIVWEAESRKDFEGLRRSGFGKADFSNVVTVNNQSQFTRYSRLQCRLI